jgi:uncharacterized membrane protein YsdA (DUF1294 family)
MALAFFVVSLFNSGFDNPFWKSTTPVMALITLINLPHAGENAIYKIILCLLVVGGILLGAMVEERIFTEEVSHEKFVSRILVVGVIGIMLVVPYMDWFGVPTFSRHAIHTSTIIMFAHILTSVAILGYLLYGSGKSLQELNQVGIQEKEYTKLTMKA